MDASHDCDGVGDVGASCTPFFHCNYHLVSPADLRPEMVYIVKSLPSENWIRQCRTLLVYITQTLAAMKLGLAIEYKQLFMD